MVIQTQTRDKYLAGERQPPWSRCLTARGLWCRNGGTGDGSRKAGFWSPCSSVANLIPLPKLERQDQTVSPQTGSAAFQYLSQVKAIRMNV